MNPETLPRNTGSIFEMEPETRRAPPAARGMALAAILTFAVVFACLLSWGAP